MSVHEETTATEDAIVTEVSALEEASVSEETTALEETVISDEAWVLEKRSPLKEPGATEEDRSPEECARASSGPTYRCKRGSSGRSKISIRCAQLQMAATGRWCLTTDTCETYFQLKYSGPQGEYTGVSQIHVRVLF